MRISVCEFLRIQTHRDWFFMNPGHWGSDRMELQAVRDEHDPDKIHIYRTKTNRRLRTLEYYEGQPSHLVRAQNRSKRRGNG